MDDFIISAVAVLIILLIIFWRASIILVYKNGTALKLRTCFVTITLVDTMKKKRLKKRKYTDKAIERRKKKEERALEKKHRRSSSEPEREKKKKFNFKFPDDVEAVISALSSFFGDLLLPIVKIGRVRFKYFKLTVASPDPADTAIRYGVLSQSVAYLLHILATNARVSKRQLSKVSLDCNFLEEKTSFELHMSVTFSVWRLLFLLIFKGHKFLGRLTKFKNKDISDTKTGKKIEGHRIG